MFGTLMSILLLTACSTTKDAIPSAPKINTKQNLAPEIVTKYKNSITAEELSEHLYVLASDGMEGRNTASRGLKLAADYISNFYHTLGLKGPVTDRANPFLQPIDFFERKIHGASIKGGGLKLENNIDFALQNGINCDKQTELVFLGYGISLPDYDDYANIDLNGKSVVIIEGEPLNSKGERLFETSQKELIPIDMLKKMGVKDILFTMPTQEMWDAQQPYLRYRSSETLVPSYKMGDTYQDIDKSFNRFLVSPSKIAALLNISSSEYFNKIQAYLDQKKPLGGLFSSQEISIMVSKSEGTIVSNNIAAYLEGTDLKDELLIISSHYDHVGVINGRIHNGADDDGSGTTGIMAVAQAFAKAAKDNYRPRRSVLFLNVTGEEKGLFGSAYYADEAPLFPLENTIANLNVDMIGRVDPKHEGGGDYIYIIGSDMLSSDLHAVHERVAKKNFPDLELDYLYNGKDHPDRFYYRSDHYNFAKNNIPVIFYFNGTHADYHKPTDTPDKIDYEMMAQRVQLIFTTAWELANIDKRPVVDKAD